MIYCTFLIISYSYNKVIDLPHNNFCPQPESKATLFSLLSGGTVSFPTLKYTRISHSFTNSSLYEWINSARGQYFNADTRSTQMRSALFFLFFLTNHTYLFTSDVDLNYTWRKQISPSDFYNITLESKYNQIYWHFWPYYRPCTTFNGQQSINIGLWKQVRRTT